jgi:hypothetical protein
MHAFSRRLEALSSEALKQHARKLRPNYDDKWVVTLKTQLLLYDRKL